MRESDVTVNSYEAELITYQFKQTHTHTQTVRGLQDDTASHFAKETLHLLQFPV